MVITVIDHLLQWSPDDRYLALQMGGAATGATRHVLDSDPGDSPHTTNDSGLMGSQSWSPDGTSSPSWSTTNPHPPPGKRTPGTPAWLRGERGDPPASPDPRPARQPPPRPRPAPDPQTRPAPHRRSHHRRRTHRSRHPHHRPGPPRPPHHLPRLGTPRRPRADIGLSTRHRRRPDLHTANGARPGSPQWKPGPRTGRPPCPHRGGAVSERPAGDRIRRVGRPASAPTPNVRPRMAHSVARHDVARHELGRVSGLPRLLRPPPWGAPPHPASSPIALL